MGTVTAEGKELRLTFIRRLMAEGDYETSIIRKCQASPLFERELSPREHRQDDKKRRYRPLARAGIRKYLRLVRRIMFDTDFVPGEELRLSYERMIRAFQMAVEEKSVAGMVKAQREIARLFGFGQPNAVEPSTVNMNTVRDQVRGMDETIGGPGSYLPDLSVAP